MKTEDQITNRYTAIAWGLLFILWGATILFDFIPFGVGLLGSGLIFLGANGMRLLNGFPIKTQNNTIGILASSWGLLELGRPILQQLFITADLDWAIFAILLVELGLISLTRELLRPDRGNVEVAQ